MSAIDTRSQRVRPSGWWYLLVPLLMVAGFAIAIDNGIDEVRTIADSFAIMDEEGVATIELEAGDEPTVWLLWDDDAATSGEDRPEVDVIVVGPGGAAVPFDAAAGSSRTTFNIDGEAGVDLGTFVAPTAGTYRVRIPQSAVPARPTPPGQPEPMPTPETVPEFAVGELDLSATILRVVSPVVLGFVAAIGLWITLLVLRGKSKRRIRRAASGDAFGGPTSPAGPTPPSPPTITSSRGPFVD